jgi:hypothetical protein
MTANFETVPFVIIVRSALILMASRECPQSGVGGDLPLMAAAL